MSRTRLKSRPPIKLSWPTPNPQSVRAIGEISGVYFFRSQYFGALKSQVPEFPGQFSGTEEKLERFARSRHPAGSRAAQAAAQIQQLRVDSEVEGHAAARRQLRDETRVAMQDSRVRYGVTPSQEKNAGEPESKPPCSSPAASVCCSKSTGTKFSDCWNRDARRLQALELPCLSSGMIDFKDSQISRMRIAVGKRVEAGAENNILRSLRAQRPAPVGLRRTGCGPP